PRRRRGSSCRSNRDASRFQKDVSERRMKSAALCFAYLKTRTNLRLGAALVTNIAAPTSIELAAHRAEGQPMPAEICATCSQRADGFGWHWKAVRRSNANR